MSQFKELVARHKIAIILAVLTSMIVAFPHVYFRIDHTEVYEDGVEAIELFSHSPWHARVREVLDGHPGLGSIYFKDGKDNPYIYQPLGTIITGYTGKVFGLGINNTLLLAKVLYSFLTFLIIYTFVFCVGGNRWAALASTSAILLSGLLLIPSAVKGLVNGSLFTNPVHYLELGAPVLSSMIFLFLFGFLVAFWQYYQKRDWRWGVVSAVLLGANVYNYFYSATYLVAFVGVLVLVFLIQKKWQDAATISYVFLGGLIVAVPYFWNLYIASQYPAYAEIAKRVALISSHAPEFIGAVAFIGLVIFLLGFPRTDLQRYLFGLSLVLTPIVTLNQQILTGKILQPGHYHWYMHKPIAIIFTAITFFYLLERWGVSQRSIKLIATMSIVVCVAIGSMTQILAYSNQGSAYNEHAIVERQRYAPVMHWLSTHAEKEAVVFANENTSWITGIYTPLNVFYVAIAHSSLVATDSRIQQLMFTYYRLRGVNHENAREVFRREKASIAAQLFGLYYRDKIGRDDFVPDEVMDKFVSDYELTLAQPTPEWLYAIWDTYEVEYVVWDRNADPEWKLAEYQFLTEEATFGDVTIYSFPSAKTE